jgi:hypothetical protein
MRQFKSSLNLAVDELKMTIGFAPEFYYYYFILFLILAVENVQLVDGLGYRREHV